MTRQVEKLQMEFGSVSISSIKFDPKSRDDIPRILRGLQYIYITESLRKQVFDLLESELFPNSSKDNGRPGMALWNILVLGVLKLDLNCDYDRLRELANEHGTIRQILGHGDYFDKKEYELQTLKDNVCLLTPEILSKINILVVKEGHKLLNKKKIL